MPNKAKANVQMNTSYWILTFRVRCHRGRGAWGPVRGSCCLGGQSGLGSAFLVPVAAPVRVSGASILRDAL